MEIINVNEIFSIVLIIYLLIGILIPIVKPIFKSIYLSRLISKGDYEKFSKNIDAYIKKAKSNREKNLFIVKKIDAMIRFREWTGIKDVIESIEKLTFSNSSIIILCNTILNLYILDMSEEGRLLVSKIENQINNQNEKVRSNLRIRLCFAIKDYFNDNLFKSKEELQKLLNVKIKSNYYATTIYQKYYTANLYFYFGLISGKQNEMMESRKYLNSAIEILYPRKCTLVNKANKMIDDISKE